MKPNRQNLIEPATFEVDGVTRDEMELAIDQAAHRATRLDSTQAVTNLELLQPRSERSREQE